MSRRRGKRTRTDSEKISQKKKTSENRIKKYRKLIKERPTDKHREYWERQLKFFESSVSE
jgi:hypothetical protein